MAVIRGKGTLYKLTISSVLTTIAQVIELDSDPEAAETFEADYLDNTDEEIPVQPTGRVSSGNISGVLFYDPDLATHQFMTDLLEDPLTLIPVVGSIVMTDTTPYSLTFNLKAVTAFGLNFRLNDGVRAPFSTAVNTKLWST